MSINRPSWVHSWAEMVQPINRDLLQRLNSDAQLSGGMWTIDATQMGLSRPGAHRIIWAIEGGSIERGHQAQGPDMPAPCVAIRKLRLRAEIRTASPPNQVGIDLRTMQIAEETLRAVMIILNKHRPADFDYEEQTEEWEDFTGETGQREIVCKFRWTLACLVLGDPYLTKPINQIDSTGEIITS